MHCGSCLHHEPPLTTPLQEVAPEPSAGLHSGQEGTRPTKCSPLGCQVNHLREISLFVHCVYKGSCRTTSLRLKHTHISD